MPQIPPPTPRAAVRAPWWSSVWFVWASTTVIYLVLVERAFECNFSPASVCGVTQIADVLGLFVPFGIWNTLLGVFQRGPLGLLSLPLCLGALYCANRYSHALQLSASTRVLYSCAVLFVLTLLTDLMIWGSWRSLFVLLHHGDAFTGYF